MDFENLIRGALPTLAANVSRGANSSAGNRLPDELLDSLSPLLGFGFQFNPLMRLFMLLHNLVGSRLGIDPAYILTVAGLFWAANKLWAQLYTTFYALARQHFMADVEVSNSDDIYHHLMKWLASQPKMVNSRSLTAETACKGAWEEEADEAELLATRMSADGSNVYLNFSNQEAKTPPRFTPAVGAHSFWFRGRYFKLHRKQEAMFDASAGLQGMSPVRDKETLVLSCFGRSPEPIKQLLQHAKEQYYLDHHAKTIVRRPATQSMRRFSQRHSWQQVADRPVRPMKTVVLDDEQKVRILSDMNEYLHPATPRWYANRGIPLRRGYLFHGPPGTGKTSLSFALAGVFGLDIYVISLLDPTLTEEDLLGLFTSLPRRCVVLLEDIDSAGLMRADDPEPGPLSSSSASDDEKDPDEAGNDRRLPGKKSRSHKNKKDWKVSDLARELKRAGGGGGNSGGGSGDGSEKKGISLSGLLNAIDGVASHEGRVLIMTTNKPEALDDALIRPGRVDLQVAFTNATQQQARELFIRMYEPESGHSHNQTPPAAPAAALSPRDRLPSPACSPASSKPAAPLITPSPPPTPVSLSSSDRDGNLTDVSGATEVDPWDDEDPFHLLETDDTPRKKDAEDKDKDKDEDESEKKNDNDDNKKENQHTPTARPKPRKPIPRTLLHRKPSPRDVAGTGRGVPPDYTAARGRDGEDGESLDNKNEEENEDETSLSAAELARVAAQFAAQIPGGQFSPAELQGFLLKRKKTPRRALAEVGAWVGGVMAQRAARSKVLGLEVQ